MEKGEEPSLRLCEEGEDREEELGSREGERKREKVGCHSEPW